MDKQYLIIIISLKAEIFLSLYHTQPLRSHFCTTWLETKSIAMKLRFLSLLAVTSLLFASCANNAEGDNKNADSPSVNTTTENSGSVTTTNDYSARADEFEKNSEAGKYMDVRTGKPVHLSVNRSTGRVTNKENNQEITRYIYVDNNDWWVYDGEGNQLGKAKWENDKVWFDDNGNWVDYDAKWKDDATDTKMKADEDETKLKTDDTKIKVEKDGDYKIKTGDKKIKKDEDGTKVKDNK